MKILFAPIHYILDSEHTGSEFSWSYYLYLFLSKRSEIDGYYITGGTRGINDPRIIDCHVFDPHVLNLSIIKVFSFYFQTLKAARAFSRKIKPDLVHHVLPFYIGNSFNIFALFTSTKYIIGPVQAKMTYHDSDLATSNARGFTKSSFSMFAVLQKIIILLISPGIRILSLITLKKAAYTIAVNEAAKEQLIQFGVPERKIRIIPPGIIAESFKITMKKDTSKQITILCVSYLLQRKRIDLVLKGLAEVVKKFTSVKLIVVGDGPQMETLQQLTREYSIESYVSFIGFVLQKDIRLYYEQADIFVSMSDAEGFATISLEAMASGLAIISSDVGGFRDLITDGQNGFIVPQGDYHMFAHKLLWLVQNKAEIARLQIAAQRTIEEQYDWERGIIPRYLAIYEELCKEK